MNKKGMLIVGGVVAALVLAGLVYFMTKDDTSDNTQTNSTQNDTASSETEQHNEDEHSQQQGNLFSISGAGKAQQCDLSYSGAGGSGTGKMYTDGKGRGLMSLSLATTQGNTGQMNTLVTSDKVYTWTATGDQAFGFVYDKSRFNTNSNTGSESSSTANPNQDFNLDCHNWTVEESKLTAPSNINFSSLPASR